MRNNTKPYGKKERKRKKEEERLRERERRRNQHIPTEEDFKRAEEADKQRNRGLNEACNRIMERFPDKDILHSVWLWYISEYSFHANIFYRWERQIEEADKSGLSRIIMDSVFEELENVGRGTRDTLTLEFEFESYEMMSKKWSN